MVLSDEAIEFAKKVYEKNKSPTEAARALKEVYGRGSVATVRRRLNLVRDPTPPAGVIRPASTHKATYKAFVRRLVEKKPMFLWEVRQKLIGRFGEDAGRDISVISRWMTEMDFTKRQGETRWIKADVAAQRSFILGLHSCTSHLPPDSVYFMDEVHVDHRHTWRRGCWGLKGQRSFVSKDPSFLGGKTFSAVIFMNIKGVQLAYVTEETYTGDRMSELIFQACKQLKILVLVMDNAPIHVLETAKTTKLVYLPPYSPVLNPCELVFSWAKGMMSGRQLAGNKCTLMDLLYTSPHRRRTVLHCGYFWL